MKVTTAELEQVCQKVLQKLKGLQIESVELNQDYYLLISSAEWTNMEKSDVDPVVGSLIDDWNNLKKVGAGEQITTFVDFDRLAAVLRAISEELNPQG